MMELSFYSCRRVDACNFIGCATSTPDGSSPDEGRIATTPDILPPSYVLKLGNSPLKWLLKMM
jgi:hypothetical protein